MGKFLCILFGHKDVYFKKYIKQESLPSKITLYKKCAICSRCKKCSHLEFNYNNYETIR